MRRDLDTLSRDALRGVWLGLLLALVAFASVAGQHPPPSPVIGPGPRFGLSEDFPPPPTGTRGFDVQSYDLDFRLDPVSSRITGTLALGLRVLDPVLSQVQLDLVDELDCTAVSWQGQPLVFSHQDDALIIALDPAWPQGRVDTLTVDWDGRPPRHGEMLVGLLFRHHNAGTLDDPSDDMPIIANVSEPWSAHSWWPCKDDPADKAQVSVAVTVPDTLSVVGNGTLQGVDPAGPGWTRYRWREQYPLPTYLVSVAASNYTSWQEICGSVPLHFHVFPQDEIKARHDFAPTCAMMEFMAGLAGPYPFAGEKYAQVEIKWVGAMEHTTASSISQLLITGDGHYETLLLHELAHQWFGDSLTPGIWADIWLNEGFARYAEALWVEHTYGRQAYREFMADIGRRRHPDFFREQGLLGDPDPILPNILVYDKGAWLLHSLRLLLGDEAFFRLVRSYVTDPQLVQGTVRTADLIRHAEQEAGRSLDSFFTPWLQTPEVPELAFRTVMTGERAELESRQMQDSLFDLVVPIVIDTEAGPVEKRIPISRREASFAWELGSRVLSVTVDPDSLVFMETGAWPPPPLQVRGPVPLPVGTDGGTFSVFTTRAGRLEAHLFDLRGRRVARYDLGEREATGAPGEQGALPFLWDWRPEGGPERLAAGVYWLEFRMGSSRSVRKFTLVH